MAEVLIRHLSDTERQLAQRAARKLYNRTLASHLRMCVRSLITAAKQTNPELFIFSIDHLKPVDRIIYYLLTLEGRRTLDDLINETGLKRETIKNAIKRLLDAQLIGAIDQGGKSEMARGARRPIYVSLNEQ